MKIIIKTTTGADRTHSGVHPERAAVLLKLMRDGIRGPFVVGDPPTFYNPRYIVTADLLYEGENRTDYSTLVDED